MLCPRGASGTHLLADWLAGDTMGQSSRGRNWGFRPIDVSGARSRHGEGVCVLWGHGHDTLPRGPPAAGCCLVSPPQPLT